MQLALLAGVDRVGSFADENPRQGCLVYLNVVAMTEQRRTAVCLCALLLLASCSSARCLHFDDEEGGGSRLGDLGRRIEIFIRPLEHRGHASELPWHPCPAGLNKASPSWKGIRLTQSKAASSLILQLDTCCTLLYIQT